ncbi:hypothetical protein [Micromonospora schwarzwaldensis]|uniref:hypothetical protein n=1 Tax=Micromonospora sp. DSM 45708 TaxID=3111767 RepID=UPI0031D7BAE9
MTSATTTARRGGPVVGLLVALWACGLIATAAWWVGIGLRQWSVSYGDATGEVADLRRRATLALLTFVLVAVAGPVLIALVAYHLRLVRTAIAFLVLAVGLTVPALPIAVHAGRDLDPAPAPTTPGPPGHCVEHSGGDTRCPGG